MGILLVFDITRRSSYTSLHNWLCDAQKLANENVVSRLFICIYKENLYFSQFYWLETNRISTRIEMFALKRRNYSPKQIIFPISKARRKGTSNCICHWIIPADATLMMHLSKWHVSFSGNNWSMRGNRHYATYYFKMIVALFRRLNITTRLRGVWLW